MQPLFILLVSDIHIVETMILLLATWKFGDWKNWKAYYPTMLFFSFGSSLYGLLTCNYPLWKYESPLLKSTLSDLLISLICFPASMLIYLPHFPKKLITQVVYILSWIIAYTAAERLSYKLGYFSYHNGWNIWWSLLFNSIMFPLLWLHHKKPQWTLLISLIIAIAILTYFKVPFR